MLAREIDGKSFCARENHNGRAGATTRFEYFVTEGGAVHGSYAGGEIHIGQLVGRITAPDRLEMRFQCITNGGELLTGQSEGMVSRGADSRLRLDYTWVWLSGEHGGGTSSYIECAPAAAAGPGLAPRSAGEADVGDDPRQGVTTL